MKKGLSDICPENARLILHSENNIPQTKSEKLYDHLN